MVFAKTSRAYLEDFLGARWALTKNDPRLLSQRAQLGELRRQ
jgi:hypothetical protein